jgi:uncharacterized protein YecT (DUF1311 family)
MTKHATRRNASSFGLGTVVAIFLSVICVDGGTAQAASFDCSKAAAPAEKTICADAKLSAQDSAMADAYTKLQAGLPEAVKSIVRRDQRDWIKSRDTLVADAARKADLPTLLQDRIAALKPSRIGTLDFLVLHGHARPPFLLSAVPGQEMFNHWARKEWNDSAPNEGDDTPAPPKDSSDPDDVRCSESFSYTINLASPALLSIDKSGSNYCEGAAHPTSEGRQFNWWLERNKTLTESDMFADKSWRKVVANEGAAQMDPDRIMDRKVLDPALISPDNWQITPKSLHIFIAQDSIFPHAAGPQEADVPWTTLQKIIKPEFSAALERATH